MKKEPKRRYIIGVDEVGRGPLAGPVCVGAMLLTPRMKKRYRNIKESKQLSERQREEWLARIEEDIGQELRYAVSFVSAKIIDTKGIQYAIRLALKRSLCKLAADPSLCEVLLDGGLRAPKEYVRQKTIIRGDAKEVAIAMASVVAKVSRDRLMVRLNNKYPDYGFERHKGYGTRAHYEAIKNHGISMAHRRSFLSRVDASLPCV